MATQVYPPATVTYSDPNITSSRFIKSPDLVARSLQSFEQLRYVGAKLLKSRRNLQGGAIMYELVANIFANATVEAVAPGSAYTRGTVSLGAAALAKAQKQGKDYPVTDESIAFNNFDPITRALLQAVNSAEQYIDQTIIAAIVSAVTTNITATATWVTTASAKILRDVLSAAATVTNQNLGYRPDTLLIDDSAWVNLAADPTIAAAMAREDTSNTVYNGQFTRLAGLDVVHVPTANMPGGVGTAGWVFDSTQLGFIAKQDLGDGYQAAGDLVESKVLRDDDLDAWRVRVRTNFVPVVNNPLAGCKINTVA